MRKFFILLVFVLFGVHLQAVLASDCFIDYEKATVDTTIHFPTSLTLDATSMSAGEELWKSETLTNLNMLLQCRGTDMTGHYFEMTREKFGDAGYYKTNNPGVALKIEVQASSSSKLPTGFVVAHNYTESWTNAFSQNATVYSWADVHNITVRVTLAATGIPPTTAPLGLSGRLSRYAVGPFPNPVGDDDVAYLSDIKAGNDVQVNLRTPGCNVNTSSLMLSLGERQLPEFTHVGYTTPYSEPRDLTFSCAAGTKMTMAVVAQADTDQPNANAIRLFAPTDPSTAKGVGVILKSVLKVDGVTSYTNDATPLNTSLSLTPDANRTWDSDQSTVVWNGGMSELDNKLSISAAYYQTLPAVTSGTANATAVINFTYN